MEQYVLALPADRSVAQDSAAALGAEDLGTRRVFDPAIRAQEDLLACLCGQSTDDATRAQLAKLLDWQEAHATFDAAVKGIPPAKRGTVPRGWAYSA